MGGVVHIRGLTPMEGQIVVDAAQEHPREQDQRALLMALMLAHGVTDPKLTTEGAIGLMQQHPVIAVRLATRIEELTYQKLKAAGIIR